MANKKILAYSNYWIRKHIQDEYVKKSYQNKIRSRSWFKLDSIQKTDKILKPGIIVFDLGSSPGGWSQYASYILKETGRIIAFDLLPMKPIHNVDFFQGKISIKKIKKIINQKKIDLIMSDMCPNITGIASTDDINILYLGRLALKICYYFLDQKGIFVVKTFHGKEFNKYLNEISKLFKKINIRKPNASRSTSSEVYIVAKIKKI
ncbi:MAG: SAM-dependent methyltransferase [Arsenophonus sp.]|nr:MAG: SAM-dependent methyltransferase [Arsenophonus sp.]